MNKQDWIKSVANQVGEPENLVATILEAGLDEIYQSMKKEEKVTLEILVLSTSMYAERVLCSSLTLLKNGGRCLAGLRRTKEYCESMSNDLLRSRQKVTKRIFVWVD
ncbi:MAG: hypothetical protein ISR58_05375 [Anaerolineales bacterium]|nr:hypothetical protein [Chloroflexota bacterium]MBL6980605.1 hypothetical protein [Anaerolineales bacterium]